MKIISSLLILCAFAAIPGAIAQDAKTAAPDWENPHVFGINKEPGRATYTPFPDGWAGRQVYLLFNGVNSAFYVWINGQKVGYGQDSRMTSEFNITKYLTP